MRNPLVAPSPLAARYGGIGHGRLSTGIADYPRILLDGTAWWRADKEITLNGSTVSAWGDLTGNGNTATQGTEANQPTYTQSAINGKPGLTFDGGTERMRMDSVASALSGDDATWTMALLLDTPSYSNGDTVLGFGNDGESNPLVEISQSSGGYFVITRDDAGNVANSGGATVTAGVHAIMVVSHGTTVSLLINGNTELDGVAFDTGQTTLNAAAMFSRVRGGSSSFTAAGVLAEAAIWSSELSDSQIASVGTYLASRGGVTW